MKFCDLRESIFQDVDNNYHHFLFKDIYSKEEDYIGCGSTSGNNHVYLTLICTLPIFENLVQAQESLLEHFGWERKFQNYTLKKEFKTSEKTIRFLSHFIEKGCDKPQAFIFRPQQLERIVELIKQHERTQKSSEELINDILKEPKSPAHNLLLKLTIKKLQNEKDLILKKNWKKATSSLKKGHLLKFIQQLWRNLIVRLHTNHFIRELNFVHNETGYFQISQGNNSCGDDVISVKCQL